VAYLRYYNSIYLEGIELPKPIKQEIPDKDVRSLPFQYHKNTSMFTLLINVLKVLVIDLRTIICTVQCQTDRAAVLGNSTAVLPLCSSQ
jgi:hypothetical protein